MHLNMDAGRDKEGRAKDQQPTAGTARPHEVAGGGATAASTASPCRVVVADALRYELLSLFM